MHARQNPGQYYTRHANMADLQMRVQNLALQGLILPIGRHLSWAYIGSLKGLPCGVIGF